MAASHLNAAALVAGQSFQSFSQAARSVLDAVAQELPGCTVLVSQLDYGEGEYRVLDARDGASLGFEGGETAELEDSLDFQMTSDRAPRLTGAAGDDPVYGALDLQSQRGIQSYVGVPLELSDGNRIGTLTALSGEPDRFSDTDLQLISVLARVLAYEWERVKRELELRRLKDEARRQDDTDPLTGIAHRRTFASLLEREWELTQRGSAESWLVVATLTGLAEANERFGHAMGDLLLKDAARALSAVARGADVVGRISGDQFAAVLVGCKGEEGAAAFCDRLRLATARITGERPAVIESSFAVRALSDAPSAVAALEAAEQQAREPLPSS